MLICGDGPDSKAGVVQLAHRMGFSPLDMGCLGAAGALEEAPLRAFPSWRGPVLTTLLLFLFLYGYGSMKNVLFPYLALGQNHFYQLPLETVNQTLPAVAMVTLALVYLPGRSPTAVPCCVIPSGREDLSGVNSHDALLSDPASDFIHIKTLTLT